MEEELRLKAREYLLRARLYRYMAFGFLVLGIVLFLLFYLRFIDGDLLGAMRRPMTVIVILLPFIPAAVLSRMSSKAEKRLTTLLNDYKTVSQKNSDKQRKTR